MPSVNTTRTFEWFALSPSSFEKSFLETISSPRSMRVLNFTRKGIFLTILISFFLSKESLLPKSFRTLALAWNITMLTRVVSQSISSCLRNVGRNLRSSNSKCWARMLSKRSINKPRSIPALQGGKTLYKRERKRQGVNY